MELSRFINNLTTDGKVDINHQIRPFSEEDLIKSREMLAVIYDQDRLHMPFQAPPFISEAAIWGATFIYRAIQFIMLREISATEVAAHLTPYPEKLDAGNIYSIDLILRYLPDLFNLAKGLAPEDEVVKQMKKVGLAFPFSAFSIELEGKSNDQELLENSSLTYAYIDRIIAKKITFRLKNPHISALVQEALGKHTDQLWPEFNHYINHT